jgi:hypothetical protein
MLCKMPAADLMMSLVVLHSYELSFAWTIREEYDMLLGRE